MRLTLDGVVFRYGPGAPVLDGVCLTVPEGTALAVMGPSGTGKSTLLALAGLVLKPEAGRVLLDGREPPRSGAARQAVRARCFAWVFQSMNVLPRRSVLDNAMAALLAHGRPRRDVAGETLRMLATVGIDAHAGRPARTLSGGELQRLCVARALLSGAPFVLADEPTGNLDASTSAAVASLLVEARRGGTSLVIATHDRAVAALCDSTVVVRDGRIEEG